MKGYSYQNPSGVYGTKGVAAPANTPCGRSYSVSWTDTSGNFWLFGGSGFADSVGNLNDLWRYEPATGNWTWMKGSSGAGQSGIYGTKGVAAADNTPGARIQAVSWSDSSGGLWLFGGQGFDIAHNYGYLSDLWRYDPVTGNWTWMKGSANTYTIQHGTYGTIGVPDPANNPGARAAAVTWTDASGALWMFGGTGFDSTNGNGYLNDLWRYDPATGNWTWMKGSSTRNQLGTYGALGVADPANTPGSRNGAVSWTDSSGALWLLGGNAYFGVADPANDLWRYEPSTGNWTWMKGISTIASDHHGICVTPGMPDPANTPGARASAVAWTDSSGALWLYGGSGYGLQGSTTPLGDLWRGSYMPVASFTATPNPSAPGQTIVFDGSASHQENPSSSIVSYAWTFGDGTTGTGSIATHAYAHFGVCTATLTVTDNNVPPLTGNVSVPISVSVGNQAPVSVPGGPYIIAGGADLALDGSGSYDPNTSLGDAIVRYEWDVDNDGAFDDATGTSPTLASATLQGLGLSAPYTGTLRLRVIDTLGEASVTSTTLQIENSQLPIWVDYGYVGPEYGTQLNPFMTLAAGVQTAPTGGTIKIKSGTGAETLRITKPLRLEAWGGSVIIGR